MSPYWIAHSSNRHRRGEMAMACSKATDTTQVPSLTWLSKVRELSLSPPHAADHRHSAPHKAAPSPWALVSSAACSPRSSSAHRQSQAEVPVTAGVLESRADSAGPPLWSGCGLRGQAQLCFVRRNLEHRQRPECGLCVNVTQQDSVTPEHLGF